MEKLNKFREADENKEITIYWWNFGKKTLDFKGSYKDCLEQRNITSEEIADPKDGVVKGWRFRIPISTATVTLDIMEPYYARGCNDAIRILLTLLGDKARFATDRQVFYINWD